MKRLFTWLIALFLLVATNADATNYDYWAYVYKQTVTQDGTMERTRIDGANVTFQVLTIDTDTAATITVQGGSTSLTNPVTAANFDSSTVCNDQVKFRSTASTHDIIVNHIQGGYSVFIEDFSPAMHSIVLDEDPGVMRHGVIWFASSSQIATDTRVNFLPDTFIHDVRLETVTVDAGEVYNIGTADTADGFRNGISVASTGYTSDTGIITSGISSDYTAVTTYGSLLYTSITGTNGDVQTLGGRSYIGHPVITSGTNDDLYYAGSTGTDTAAGYIHYWFTRMR